MPHNEYPAENAPPPELSIEDLQQIVEEGPPSPPPSAPKEPELDQTPLPPGYPQFPERESTGVPPETGFGGDITPEDLAIDPEELAKILSQYQGESKGKIDPVVARYAVRYFELWGVAPPPGYIEKIIKSGMNIYEFEDFERSKPAFRRTETYQNEYAQAAEAVARLLGLR